VSSSTENDLWLRRYHPAKDAGVRLVCFPHAGGAATYYHSLSAALCPAVDVVAVQYPGRQDRRGEPLIDDVTVLADKLLSAVSTDWTDSPLAFFGHSMGASIAFEVARRLESRGVRLAVLFVSGRPAPSMPRRGDQVHLSDDAAVLAEMKRLSGTESELLEDDDFVRMVLPVVRNDYKAIETYRYTPGTNVSCPVLAMIGDDDPKVNQAEAEAWRSHTTGQFDLRVYRGGHFYLNDHREAVNRLLMDRLAAVAAPS